MTSKTKRTKHKKTPQERSDEHTTAFIAAHYGQKVSVRTQAGFDLDVVCGDRVGDLILRTGIFEPELSHLFSKLMAGARRVIDLGANIGYFSCLAAMREPGARIVAVEPNPALAAIARGNFSRLPADIRLLELAVSEKAGSLELVFPMGRPSLGTLGQLEKKAKYGETQRVTVPVETMKYVLEEVGEGDIDLMKTDLEGMDVRVLCSLSEAEAARFANIICEFNEDRLAQCQSSRADLMRASWLHQFDVYVVGYLGTPYKADSLAEFPVGCETLWLRRK